MSLKRFVVTYPVSFGMLLAVFLAGAGLGISVWFPSFTGMLGRHERLCEGILFTILLFVGWVSSFWKWRRYRAFLPITSGFFAIHLVGVLAYSIYVGPILVWQWSILMFSEVWVFTLLFAWSAERFGHSNKREHR
jgi:hypothetical protein